jgi:hypothetical protein
VKNIVFSTTRQWNCGDEFILFGCINILKELIGQTFNPIIYNRHPDALHEFVGNRDIYASDGLCLRDNSLKRYMDAGFIDLVVFAGTPEWSNYRCLPLYEMINQYGLPALAIGVGLRNENDNPMIKDAIGRFKLLTVRSPDLIEQISEREAIYLPCPSIAAATAAQEKTIKAVKKVALIYSGDNSRSVLWNCVSTETYAYLKGLYDRLLQEYSEDFEFSVVCHYCDELPYAIADFPKVDCLYSFDAKDYFDIYNNFDLVIGCRVHGLGICASMGIPGIGIAHDFRSGTLQGFLADVATIDTDYQTVFEMFDKAVGAISEKNRELLAHKNKVVRAYTDLIDGAIGDSFSAREKATAKERVFPQDTSRDLRGMIYETNRALNEAKHKLPR